MTALTRVSGGPSTFSLLFDKERASRDGRGGVTRQPRSRESRSNLPPVTPAVCAEAERKGVLTESAAGERGAGGTCVPRVVRFGTSTHLINQRV